MKRLSDTARYTIVIVAIGVAVCVLGFLQYRWTSGISTTEQQRLSRVLSKSAREFDQKFAYGFERLGETFEIDPEEQASTIDARLLKRYLDWNRSASHPELLAGVYVWREDGGRKPYVESLDRARLQFRASGWPSEIEALKPELENRFVQLPSLLTGHDAVYWPWRFHGDAVALVRPLFQMMTPARDSDMEVEPIGFLLVAIDRQYLKSRYFPELIGDDLAASGFKVAIRSASPPYKTTYLSDPAFPISTNAPDAEVNLFDSVAEEAKRRGHPSVDFDGEGQQWQLVAQHSSGSVESAVAHWRNRNLAFSFALLLILLGCVGLVFSVARRAERLGKFQMQFVAGISHELCTPLTVVNSAIENVADGIIDDPAKVREYAAILRDQSNRLSRLLDQVLLLASGKLGQSFTELQPVEVSTVVMQTIAASEKMLLEKQFTLQKQIAIDVPSITADPVLLSECVENLISNAVKYAGTNRWIGVRVRQVASDSPYDVQISVEDRGVGIAPSDLQRIFEPFYRVQAVADGQVRGVGLGLYLVKRMVETMGGKVSVSSELGRGSCFVLHFPVSGSFREGLAATLSSPSPAK